MTPESARTTYQQWPPDLKAAIRHWAQMDGWFAEEWPEHIARCLAAQLPAHQLTRLITERNQHAQEARALMERRKNLHFPVDN